MCIHVVRILATFKICMGKKKVFSSYICKSMKGKWMVAPDNSPEFLLQAAFKEICFILKLIIWSPDNNKG